MLLLSRNKKIRKITFDSFIYGLFCGELLSFFMWHSLMGIFLATTRTKLEAKFFEELYYYHYILDVMLMAIFWCVGVCKMLVEEMEKEKSETSI